MTKTATHLDEPSVKTTRFCYIVYLHKLFLTFFSFSYFNLFSPLKNNAKCHMYEHQGKCYLLSPHGEHHSGRLPAMHSGHTSAMEYTEGADKPFIAVFQTAQLRLAPSLPLCMGQTISNTHACLSFRYVICQIIVELLQIKYLLKHICLR